MTCCLSAIDRELSIMRTRSILLIPPCVSRAVNPPGPLHDPELPELVVELVEVVVLVEPLAPVPMLLPPAVPPVATEPVQPAPSAAAATAAPAIRLNGCRVFIPRSSVGVVPSLQGSEWPHPDRFR
jgi:hypothetical protein